MSLDTEIGKSDKIDNEIDLDRDFVIDAKNENNSNIGDTSKING